MKKHYILSAGLSQISGLSVRNHVPGYMQRVGSTTHIHLHYSALKPIYIPVGEGYCLLTRTTTQAGATLRLPLPRRPYFSNINCL